MLFRRVPLSDGDSRLKRMSDCGTWMNDNGVEMIEGTTEMLTVSPHRKLNCI